MALETDYIFSTLGTRRAGHGARARARLAAGGSPVDCTSDEPRGTGRARPARKRPAGRKKNGFTLLYTYVEDTRWET